MAEYDPKIIHKFADKLYSQAQTILVTYSVLFGLLGAVVIYVINASAHTGITVWIGLALGVLIGYGLAQERAFKLKLEAQIALCQIKIEENTRK